ncbi:hypothetical protein BCR44DRAFT_1441189, partial [Catenaria anguillulae PL171]
MASLCYRWHMRASRLPMRLATFLLPLFLPLLQLFLLPLTMRMMTTTMTCLQ